MIPDIYLQHLTGGALIGLSAALLHLVNGRAANVIGIFAKTLSFRGPDLAPSMAFIVGLVLGPILYNLAFDAWPVAHFRMPLLFMALAGVLVGYGTRLGGGCTSGHGIVGVSRLSRRSFAAVAMFIASGVATVFLMRLLEML